LNGSSDEFASRDRSYGVEPDDDGVTQLVPRTPASQQFPDLVERIQQVGDERAKGE